MVSGALSAGSLGLGFLLGQLYSGYGEPSVDLEDSSELAEESQDNEEDLPEDTQDILDGDLSAISAGLLEPCKLVSLARRSFPILMEWKIGFNR